MSKHPPKGGSGEHPAVVAFREKMDSIQEHTLPEAEKLLERIEQLKSDRPKDPRRDGDSDPPVDVVDAPDGGRCVSLPKRCRDGE